jgi:adenosylmethionine-8-amino-7-oxononanoate aminotransferase
VALHGAETIAAVIVEPVPGLDRGAAAAEDYLQRLRELCDKHGILLIFDEVITGFGRLGTPFAAQHFGVTPDLMTTAKGITNGTIPCGAVFRQPQDLRRADDGPRARSSCSTAIPIRRIRWLAPPVLPRSTSTRTRAC